MEQEFNIATNLLQYADWLIGVNIGLLFLNLWFIAVLIGWFRRLHTLSRYLTEVLQEIRDSKSEQSEEDSKQQTAIKPVPKHTRTMWD